MTTTAGLEATPEQVRAISAESAFLASPGTWFTGAERVAIAAEARRAMAESLGEGVDAAGSLLDDSLTGIVRTVAASSPLISDEWVAALDIESPVYAEVIGVVSRLSSVDFFHRAMGLDLPALPDPDPGEPTRTPPPADLVYGKSYVPMVEPVSIPNTISIVPAETKAWYALSDAMYMTFEEMGDPDFRKTLHRTQIELVAARTSQINECFY